VPSPLDASETPSYRGYRYPVEIISHAVWLYFRFHLSLRDVEGHRQVKQGGSAGRRDDLESMR